MKKVGIFTIYIANYGAVLQTYALQKYLRETYPDLDVQVVDFYTHEPYAIFKKASDNPIKNILRQSTKLLHYCELRRRNSREQHFIKEEFILSPRYDNVDELMANMPQYDIYLTGSDQVFNVKSRYSALFYQTFSVKGGIKAAYAPSFGTSEFTDDYKSAIRKSISTFSFLSCREDDGASVLSELKGQNIPCVLDPTLLLNKEQWSKVMSAPMSKDKYLLIYDLNGGQKLVSIAKPIANQNGWKIWCITQHTDIRYKGVDRLIYDAGPREFIGLFSEAQYVITDSFHGTAFSIIFEKLFNTYIAVPRAARRIESLLKECGMSERVIRAGEKVECMNVTGPKSMTDFMQLKELSKKFINDIVAA